MRICFIGAFGHYVYALQALQEIESIESVGISCGYSGENISEVYQYISERGYKASVFSTHSEMLDVYQPDIAVISSRLDLNAGISVQALERGVHVFSEKPVATSTNDLFLVKNAYIRANIAHKTYFATMLGLRYAPSFYTAWKLTEDENIGDIRLINTQKSYKFGNRDEFFKHRNLYGGTIPWVGIHAVDWLQWYSSQHFESVYAVHSTMNNHGYESLEMTALCLYTLGNGILGSVSMDYLRPDNADTHGDDRVRLVGTRGIIEVQAGKVFLASEEKMFQEMPLQKPGNIFIDFINQVETGKKCRISAEESFMATEAVLLARQSADEGKILSFQQA